MARCAAFVLGTGQGSFAALDASLESLRSERAGVNPDVFVCMDMLDDTGKEWLRKHAGEVQMAYTHPELLGWPIMLNVALDQELEAKEWDYDVVVLMHEGVAPQAKNWLRDTLTGIEREGSECVVSLGGPENIGDHKELVPLGDDTFMVPRLWGGAAMPGALLRKWRAVPYLPVRGNSWIDDLSDHCVINNKLIYHDPRHSTLVPTQIHNFQSGAGFDGGLLHGEA